MQGIAVHGDCDFTSADRLSWSLIGQERRHGAFEVDLADVSFADTNGLAPLAESVRRRIRAGLPLPLLVAPSPSVLRVFDTLGVAHCPFDLAAWDQAGDTGCHRHGPEGIGPPVADIATRQREVTTLIQTPRLDAHAATIQVSGVLDHPAAVLVCELILAHTGNGRTDITINVRDVDDADPDAIDLLARVAAASPCWLTMTALIPHASKALANTRPTVLP